MGPTDELRIGEKAIRDGVLSPSRVNWCLDLRSQIQKWGIHPPGIGEIARAKGWCSKDQVAVLYGISERPPVAAPAAPARRSFRERRAKVGRRGQRRGALLQFVLAALATGGGLLIELFFRR